MVEAINEKRSTKRKLANVEALEQWEQKKGGDNRYEFYYGEIIKKPGVKQIEFFIIQYLLEAFLNTSAKAQKGALLPEADVYIDADRKRIPDLAYFTRVQVVEAAKGIKVVPAFAIEILSKNESWEQVETKLQDYFDAGIRLVWYVSVKRKKIYAYTAINEVTIFLAGETATANPVLPDFVVDIEKMLLVE